MPAHVQRWKILELFLVFPLLLAAGLQLLCPLTLGSAPVRIGLGIVGGGFFVASVWLVVQARRELAAHQQPTDPGAETTVLVTTGPFALSRNPLSLATLGLLTGIGLLMGLLWALVLVVPTAGLLFLVLIRPEERYLTAAFGDRYQVYRRSVNRWWGRET